MSNKILQRKDIALIAEAAVMLALTIVLNMFKLYKLPTGGSVTLFGYLPLCIFALRHGWLKGVLLGALYGLTDFLREPYFVNVIQVFLDYIFSYAALGLAGIFVNNKEVNTDILKIKNIAALLFGGFVRFAFAVISGIFFFSNESFYPALTASAIYNGPYVLVNTLMALGAVAVLAKPLLKLKK